MKNSKEYNQKYYQEFLKPLYEKTKWQKKLQKEVEELKLYLQQEKIKLGQTILLDKK